MWSAERFKASTASKGTTRGLIFSVNQTTREGANRSRARPVYFKSGSPCRLVMVHLKLKALCH